MKRFSREILVRTALCGLGLLLAATAAMAALPPHKRICVLVWEEAAGWHREGLAVGTAETLIKQELLASGYPVVNEAMVEKVNRGRTRKGKDFVRADFSDSSTSSFVGAGAAAGERGNQGAKHHNLLHSARLGHDVRGRRLIPNEIPQTLSPYAPPGPCFQADWRGKC